MKAALKAIAVYAKGAFIQPTRDGAPLGQDVKVRYLVRTVLLPPLIPYRISGSNRPLILAD